MSVGLMQLLVILVIILMIFGSGKLPNVMSDFGKGFKLLKKTLKEDDKDNKEDDKDNKK